MRRKKPPDDPCHQSNHEYVGSKRDRPTPLARVLLLPSLLRGQIMEERLKLTGYHPQFIMPGQGPAAFGEWFREMRQFVDDYEPDPERVKEYADLFMATHQ